MLRRSIDVRNPYVDPINLLQVELLRRLRSARERTTKTRSGCAGADRHDQRHRGGHAQYRLTGADARDLRIISGGAVGALWWSGTCARDWETVAIDADTPVDVAEGEPIEDLRGCVAHIFHRQANAARALVNTFRAGRIGGPTDARNQRRAALPGCG